MSTLDQSAILVIDPTHLTAYTPDTMRHLGM